MSLVFQFINNPLMEGLLFLLVAKIVLVDFEESLTVCQVKFDVTQCIIRYYPMINLTELSLMILESNWFQLYPYSLWWISYLFVGMKGVLFAWCSIYCKHQCISSTKSLEKTQRASPVYCMVVHLGSQKIAWGPVF